MSAAVLPNIALIGKSGSGKTTVAMYLIQNYGYTRASTGDICREVCRILFANDSKNVMNRVTDAIKEIDENVWLRAALAAVQGKRRIVFDSMRFHTDYEALMAEGFCAWRIEAPLRVRVERMAERNQSYDPRVDELHRTENELEGVAVDIEISNGSNDHTILYEKIEDALRRL